MHHTSSVIVMMLSNMRHLLYYICVNFKFKYHEAIIDEDTQYISVLMSCNIKNVHPLPSLQNIRQVCTRQRLIQPQALQCCTMLYFPPRTSETNGDIFPPRSSVPAHWFSSCLLIDITLSVHIRSGWLVIVLAGDEQFNSFFYCGRFGYQTCLGTIRPSLVLAM